MAKIKSAISGEYVVSVQESGSITVFRIFDNVKASLREAANEVGFAYDTDWTTRQFGAKLIKAYGMGDEAQVGNYFIHRLPSGSIETYRTFDNTKGALREIAEKIGFSYNPDWTTRQFGSKLVDYINEHK